MVKDNALDESNKNMKEAGVVDLSEVDLKTQNWEDFNRTRIQDVAEVT